MTAMRALHPGEVSLSMADVRRLVDTQFPQWAGLPLTLAGAGTDNHMVRLGEELVVRLPRIPQTAAVVAKEVQWLPRLEAALPVPIPEPVERGVPDDGYPFDWAVFRWIDGDAPDPAGLVGPERFAADLAGFVAALHGVDLAGARREPPLKHYRGGRLSERAEAFAADLAACARLPVDLDVSALQRVWDDAAALEETGADHTWMHTDLKPSNLIVRDGRLAGVIDFGGLSVGDPTCEHAATWDLPERARETYADLLDLDEATRLRARAWAAAIALSGLPYYWTTYPSFVGESLRRLQNIST